MNVRQSFDAINAYQKSLVKNIMDRVKNAKYEVAQKEQHENPYQMAGHRRKVSNPECYKQIQNNQNKVGYHQPNSDGNLFKNRLENAQNRPSHSPIRPINDDLFDHKHRHRSPITAAKDSRPRFARKHADPPSEEEFMLDDPDNSLLYLLILVVLWLLYINYL